MAPRLLLAAATAVALAACSGEKDTGAPPTTPPSAPPLRPSSPPRTTRTAADRLGMRFEIIDLESGETVGRAAPRLETWLLYFD